MEAFDIKTRGGNLVHANTFIRAAAPDDSMKNKPCSDDPHEQK